MIRMMMMWWCWWWWQRSNDIYVLQPLSYTYSYTLLTITLTPTRISFTHHLCSLCDYSFIASFVNISCLCICVYSYVCTYVCIYTFHLHTSRTYIYSCIYAHKILRIYKHLSTLVYLFVCLIIYLFVCHALLLYVNCSACAYTFILFNACAHYCVYTSSMLPCLQSHTHEDIIYVPTHQVCCYFCLCSVYCFMNAPTCLYTICVFHHMYVCLLMIYTASISIWLYVWAFLSIYTHLHFCNRWCNNIILSVMCTQNTCLCVIVYIVLTDHCCLFALVHTSICIRPVLVVFNVCAYHICVLDCVLVFVLSHWLYI